MNILVTGSKGFVGKNLCCALKNGRSRSTLLSCDVTVFEYDIDTEPSLLGEYCKSADFVFHLAGVNRPESPDEFLKGNSGFTSTLLDTLKKQGNKCPVMLASSVQASLTGRFYGSEYGKSKKAAEDLFFDYSKQNDIPVYVFRFPNIFGKWCRADYNSAVATFCSNIANGIPPSVSDRDIELTLLYIDDLVDEMFNLLNGNTHRCDYDGLNIIDNPHGSFCYCPVTYNITLGKIVDLLEGFEKQSGSLIIPEMPCNSFEKKLYSVYMSYLPEEKASFPLKMNIDNRGSFTELLKSEKCGQVSVNISKPGIIKGQHWHNTKWELFIVVSGKGLIQQRKIGTDEILSFEVSGDKIEAVRMLPGYTHNIINLSDTEDLITIMWANEQFDSSKPDTFFEAVE